MAVEHPLGWLQLEKGRHTLSFICTGRDGRSAGYFLGINDVVLERIPEAAENLVAPPAGTRDRRGRISGPTVIGLSQAAKGNRPRRRTAKHRSIS